MRGRAGRLQLVQERPAGCLWKASQQGQEHQGPLEPLGVRQGTLPNACQQCRAKRHESDPHAAASPPCGGNPLVRQGGLGIQGTLPPSCTSRRSRLTSDVPALLQLADMLLDLDQNRLLLCDLQMKRIYVNTTAYKPVISAGRSQYTYGYRKFHSGAWCFTDEQCHSCFKSSRNENMDWLPEAKCDRETNRCPVSLSNTCSWWVHRAPRQADVSYRLSQGYDANSQATALVRKVLWPMLFLNETNKGESGRKVSVASPPNLPSSCSGGA